MAYYFYNTAEQLARKVKDLEKELNAAEEKFNGIDPTGDGLQEILLLEDEIAAIIGRIRCFTWALKQKA